VCVCVWTYIYIYIYIHTYLHTCIYIHKYVHTGKRKDFNHFHGEFPPSNLPLAAGMQRAWGRGVGCVAVCVPAQLASI
jgi:hypothetical protein